MSDVGKRMNENENYENQHKFHLEFRIDDVLTNVLLIKWAQFW